MQTQKQKNNPRVVVLLPICGSDDASLLSLCLGSIKDQVGDIMFSLCIGCDGPIPEVLERSLEYHLESADTVVRCSKRQGLSSILNKMIARFPGADFFIRIDADDLMMPNRITEQVQFIESNPCIDCVGSAAILINKKGEEMGVSKKATDHNLLVKNLRLESPFFHPSVCVRARFFQNVGLYNEGLMRAQDLDLWYRGLIAGMLYANIDRPLIKYRIGEVGSKTGFQNAVRFLRITLPYEFRLFGWKGRYSFILLRAFVRVFMPKKFFSLAYGKWLRQR